MEMKTEWEWLTKTIYEPEVTWAMVTAIATVLLVIGTAILAWAGVLPLFRARRAELTERFREELLTPTAKRILFLLAHNLLDFRTDPTTGSGFFFIMPAPENIIAQRLEQILGPQRIVLTFEMDDEILAPLQEVAYYEADGAIDFDDAFRIFGQQIDIAM